jgi:hypothetical protein
MKFGCALKYAGLAGTMRAYVVGPAPLLFAMIRSYSGLWNCMGGAATICADVVAHRFVVVFIEGWSFCRNGRSSRCAFIVVGGVLDCFNHSSRAFD